MVLVNTLNSIKINEFRITKQSHNQIYLCIKVLLSYTI